MDGQADKTIYSPFTMINYAYYVHDECQKRKENKQSSNASQIGWRPNTKT